MNIVAGRAAVPDLAQARSGRDRHCRVPTQLAVVPFPNPSDNGFDQRIRDMSRTPCSPCPEPGDHQHAPNPPDDHQ
jgi:hypothetical protein